MKENHKTTCDPCEQDFKRKVEDLVKEGHAPSHVERTKREHEVKAAFDKHPADAHHDMKHPAKENKTEHAAHAAKPAPEKHHAMAGGAKMKK